jgi:hypothetical protein
VTLVVVDDSGRVLGGLPPYEVTPPWWQECVSVVAGARDRYGVDVTVLRLLRADRPRSPGGQVAYAVQLSSPYGLLRPVDDALRALAETDDPHRADYARPGGPQATVAWARAALAAAGLGPVLSVAQQRTWNLSAIWRLATPTGDYWLKRVPPFFAHEPAVLRHLATDHGPHVPSLVAVDGRRFLMAQIPGEDLYDAPADVRLAIAADWHAIQSTVDVATLLDLGVPDRRSPGPWLASVARSFGDPSDDRLRRLVDGLADRLTRVAACGLPDTLVHGDLHGGNVIGSPDGARVILDWGDCIVGHPAFDILRLIESLSPDEAADVVAQWASWWRLQVPGSDPEAALDLLRPLQELRFAAVMADFIASIEATEQPYHRDDVPDGLARAAALTR